MHQGKKRGSWSDAPSRLVPPVPASGGSPDLGLLQLVRSSFRSFTCPKRDITYLNDQLSPSFLFFPRRHEQVPRRSRQNSPGSNCESGSGSMSHLFHTWIGHHTVETSTPWRIFGMCWRSLCNGPTPPSSIPDIAEK